MKVNLDRLYPTNTLTAVQIKGAVMNIISACSLLPSFPLHASFRIIDNGPITEKVVLPHRLFIHRLRLYLLVA